MSEVQKRTKDRPLQSARVVLCEGADEYDILMRLRDEKEFSDADVEIQNVGGRGNLQMKLGDLRYQTGGEAIRLVSVVLDAEDRKQEDVQLKTNLEAVATQYGWSLMMFELPNDTDFGALETLVRTSVDGKTQQAQCASRWELCLGDLQVTRTQAQKDKAWLHVWLAGFGDIYSRVGYAFDKNPEVRDRLSVLRSKFDDILTRTLNHSLA